MKRLSYTMMGVFMTASICALSACGDNGEIDNNVEMDHYVITVACQSEEGEQDTMQKWIDAASTELSAKIATAAFRAQLIVFPLQAWVMLCNMMLQNIGMTVRATIVAMSRQGLAFIPMVFLLPFVIQLCGGEALLGLELSQAVADVIAFIISLPIGISVLREMKQAQNTPSHERS